jgi:hypothetical protein
MMGKKNREAAAMLNTPKTSKRLRRRIVTASYSPPVSAARETE